ncbi:MULTISPECIES: hypothetical protein [Reichenbachiella]|uniref:Uncharacterized protein n=1 Tax=Reichenbachiella agariperforans TaxID=156994 RepID=A0A1M6JMU9_REIAG|nr:MULTISPECIES: hypothetical protein [Reichenbachiella]MBU2913259.1 hypothetical protein [Reichenbachiella agariperforans]RJE74751.1 hypothetical protein BGP76_16595 [Reichenbachiella sp. MSK19-1]SHJ48006.1 hypothetical protein SAMN04488028_101251 [Reichenbachiella agariperforans]
MPANPKHLTKAIHQRMAKITAAILGGYLLTTAVHLALATWLDKGTVLITSTYTGFILWVALMIIAFLGRNGWKTWGIYLLLTGFFSILVYVNKIYFTVETAL